MTNPASRVIINLAFAGVAHLVERDLAKVEVASSSLVARSRKHHLRRWCFQLVKKVFFDKLRAVFQNLKSSEKPVIANERHP